MTNINNNFLNTQAVNDNQVKTKAYADQFHQDNERSRRDVGLGFCIESTDLVKSNQDNNFNENNKTNLDSITVKRDPTSDIELASKNYVDDSIGHGKGLRINQTLENYLKASVGNDVYNLTKNDKIQIADNTITIYPNIGGYLLQSWIIECNDKNNNGKIQYCMKTAKTNKKMVIREQRIYLLWVIVLCI